MPNYDINLKLVPEIGSKNSIIKKRMWFITKRVRKIIRN